MDAILCAAQARQRRRLPGDEASSMNEFEPCSVCARTPLVGEAVTVIGDRQRESAVCDLCLDRPRAARLGVPLRRERVRAANTLDVAANSSIAA
jgi:hypothetical protein